MVAIYITGSQYLVGCAYPDAISRRPLIDPSSCVRAERLLQRLLVIESPGSSRTLRQSTSGLARYPAGADGSQVTGEDHGRDVLSGAAAPVGAGEPGWGASAELRAVTS